MLKILFHLLVTTLLFSHASLSDGLIAHYEFENGFYNEITQLDDDSKWDNSENIIVSNGYLNLKNSYDGDLINIDIHDLAYIKLPKSTKKRSKK